MRKILYVICDGLIYSGNIKLLVEYKYKINLKDSMERAKVLLQVLFYLKNFEINGEILPNIIMVADKDELFLLHSNSLINYLDEDIDWSVAPSISYLRYSSLLRKIAINESISPFIYNIDNSFSFNIIERKIREIASNVSRLTKLTEHNLSRSYNDFCQNVIINSEQIPTNDLVGIFIRVITDRDNCYKHPFKNNILVCNNNEYKINGNAFDIFFSHFEHEYSVKEKMLFTEISDRLIEDTKRRRSGEFYTPTIFADYAHKMLSEHLGEDWKEKYTVWDCCWGTGNLTRDYKFRDLYCSTLEQAELECGKRYNPESTKFVFDFLNDDIISPPLYGNLIPQKLDLALRKNKSLLFLINPPFATASSDFSGGKGQNTCKTNVTKQMIDAGLSNSSKNLFAQFLYNIITIKRYFHLEDVALGLFCNPIYLSGSSFDTFRNIFLNEFCYKDGILFNASQFANVSNIWGISYTVWKSGISQNKHEFPHKIVNVEEDTIKIYGKKTIYNGDDMPKAKDWIKEPILNISEDKIQRPTLSSGITVRKNSTSNTTIFRSALGCYLNVGNDVYNSSIKVAIFSSCDNSNANGISVMPDNFKRICAIFSARKLVSSTWINNKDIFLAPKVSDIKYNEFINDSIIYSLFHSSSQQTSLRDIMFNNMLWDIKNEFFYLSKEDIMELADNFGLDYTFNDAKQSSERYVYNKIRNIDLSNEAQDVINYAKLLTKMSFKYRKEFNDICPEYQILNWDCGWYQIKPLIAKHFPEQMNKFKEKYKKLSDKMLPFVYKLEFIK